MGNVKKAKQGGNGPKIKTEAEAQGLEAVLGGNSIDTAMRRQDSGTALQLLLLQDEEVLDNAMRYDLRNAAECVAAATLLSNMAHNPTAIYEIKLLLGLKASIGARRVNLASETIIGERRNFQQQNGNGGTLPDKIKKLAFGD